MSRFSEFARYDGLGLAELVRGRQVSPTELFEETISRIEAANPRINAVVHRLYDSARLAAAGPLSGPFAGVPFLLKDLMAPLAGAPMSQGNRRLAVLDRDYDREIVRRYRAAGLIIVGKTNVPEFGLAPVTEPEAFGPCRNPYDLSLTPGGSSGLSGSGRSAAGTHGARHRWRRLDTYPLLVLRPRWNEADTRAHAARPDRRRKLARLLGRSRGYAVGARLRGPGRCDARRRSRRPIRNQASGPPLSRRGWRPGRQAADRLYDHAVPCPFRASRLR
jgi:Amidase